MTIGVFLQYKDNFIVQDHNRLCYRIVTELLKNKTGSFKPLLPAHLDHSHDVIFPATALAAAVAGDAR